MAGLSLDDKGAEVKDATLEMNDIPEMDDIPDMEDEGAGLEEEDEAVVRVVHPDQCVLCLFILD